MPLSRIKVNSVSPTGNVVTNLITNEGSQIAFRNKIINGDFSIWQRGTSFSSGTTSFCADRWSKNSSTGTITQSTDVPTGQGFAYSMRTAASNQAICILQPVELAATGVAGEFSVGSTWTYSFWMKGASAGSITLSFEFRDEGISGTNYVTAATGSTINYTTSWAKYTVTFTITGTPAGTNTGLSPILYQGSQTNTVYFTGAQLEKGSVASPFEFRPRQTELALCQRYFYRLSDDGGNNIGCLPMFITYASNRAFGHCTVPVPMRTFPSISISNVYSWTGGGYGTAPAWTSLSVYDNLNSVGHASYYLEANAASGFTGICIPYFQNGAAGFINFSAEI